MAGIRERGRGVRDGVIAQLARKPKSYWGMTVAHLGVAVFIIGVTMVKGYETERDVRMAVGDTVAIGGYTFRFEGVTEAKGPNFHAARGMFDVSRDGTHVTTLFPEKRVYNAGGMPMTEAAIESEVTGGAWSVRVYSKPFVTWIWAGCLLMALGGLLAISDRRYRVTLRREAALPGGAAAKMY